VSAYGELTATGAIGDETLDLLRRLSAQYTRTHSFPPPDGYDRWNDEAVDDLLAAMFSDKGPAFVMACLAGASDQASLERMLLATIGNYLKDGAKRTERGKLRRRLRGLLERDPRFVRFAAAQVGVDGWALAGTPPEFTRRSIAELQGAALAVRGVSVTRWNTAGPTPTGTRHALLTVAEAVLAAAEGIVGDDDLARVLESRFALIAPPRFTQLDYPGLPGEAATHPDDEPSVLVAVDDRAEDLWQSLTQLERSLLPHLGEPDDVLATISGVGPREARAIADTLAEKLRLATVDDQQHDDLVLALLALCQTRP
jgi:hypothetical protein